MATSDRRGALPAWFGSRAHYVGSGGAVLGLVISLVDGLGTLGAAVVGGLYGAGALATLMIAPLPPPPPPPPPVPPPTPTPTPVPLDELAAQRERVAQSRWPEASATRADLLLDRLADRLAAATPPSPAAAEELRELLDATVTVLDHYERDRCWARLEPGGPPPEGRFTERLDAVLARLGRQPATQP